MFADEDDDVGVEIEADDTSNNDHSRSSNNFNKQINDVLKPYINKLKEV